MQVISRAEAKAQGLKRYFTGEPCKRGHVAERYTSSKECMGCISRKEVKAIKSESARKWYAANKARVSENSRKWYERNKERAAASEEKWREANKERKALSKKRWREKNKERALETQRRWRSRQYATCPEYRAGVAMRNMLRRTLDCKTESTQSLLGYSAAELREHIECQFLSGMSWDNHGHGGWHIDHIRPIAQFIKDGETDPAKINCLSNLRPVWAIDNLTKGGRVELLL